MILLVVDAQKEIVSDALYEAERFVSYVAALIAAAREHRVEVAYVRHDGGAGSGLGKDEEGFAIFEAFAPRPGERIFDKTCNSPFRQTGLLAYLAQKHEDALMLVGLQTDYCIDATVTCGFEHGLRMLVPAHANTTVDNAFMTAEQSYRYHNEFLWNRRYAACMPLQEALRRLAAE